MFNNGKITFVGKATAKIARQGTVIDATGKQVYPGFIAANASLGLVEIDAVRATDDEDEVGSMLPHIRSLIAYNAESKVVESMRPNGVLMGQITPEVVPYRAHPLLCNLMLGTGKMLRLKKTMPFISIGLEV